MDAVTRTPSLVTHLALGGAAAPAARLESLAGRLLEWAIHAIEGLRELAGRPTPAALARRSR